MMPAGLLRERALDAVEDMDKPDCDLRRLNRSYARFPVVNRLLSGWHGIYRERIRPLLLAQGSATLLDIGCGGGDVARALAGWALRDGLKLEVTGIDPDDRAFRFASRAVPNDAVTYRRCFSGELVAEGCRFDVVISNHILHHLTPGQLAGVLGDSEQLCSGWAFHNDLRRSAAAYYLFLAGFWPLGLGSYICGDGLTSIRRSYTPEELRMAVPQEWQVERHGPWHNLLTYRQEERAGA
ncbi:class I SAM-dependent methyltransferase [Arthrobacter cavernae]|uniref:Methyltransferase domain-containing protein n=1 Tax=Arthrobacter cavernae TaxID=2817681 RepID=A0A939HKL0_9MICC|nr:class I SAM-dependent methyltransferase [Arthrobacter cavernae]MBO1269105.1 methyltransferase domain-containing protein [Arthrobacter cavernae]